MAEPLLRLDTLAEQPTVLIDKVPYALALTDALSLMDYFAVIRLVPRFHELLKQAGSETLTEEEETEANQTLDKLCRIVLQAPPEIHERLTDAHRLAVYKTFLMLSPKALRAALAQPTTEPTAKPTRRTGGRSSRGSRASTASIQGPGSEPSRLAS